MQERVKSIVLSIEHCAKVCDSYRKLHTAGTYVSAMYLVYALTSSIVKFLNSMKWERKFAAVAQRFSEHQEGIKSDLQIHVSIGITTANTKLSELNLSFSLLNQNVSMLMKVVFERLQTPKERDLSALVESREPRGIEAALKNDKLLEEVLAKANQKETFGMLQQKGGPGKGTDDKGVKKRTLDMIGTITELRKEVDKDVEQVLADNTFFDKKFEVMCKMQVEEMKHESDRVIGTLRAGPHNDIHHPVRCTLCLAT